MQLQKTSVVIAVVTGSLLFGRASSAQDKAVVDHGIKVYAA